MRSSEHAKPGTFQSRQRAQQSKSLHYTSEAYPDDFDRQSSPATFDRNDSSTYPKTPLLIASRRKLQSQECLPTPPESNIKRASSVYNTNKNCVSPVPSNRNQSAYRTLTARRINPRPPPVARKRHVSAM